MIRSRHRSWESRWLGLILLLLQLGFPAAVSAVELLNDADPAGRVVHVESEATDDCALHHDHHFCQVVRNLVEGQRGADAPPVAVLRPEVDSSTPSALQALDVRSAWLQDRHSPRAPPTA